MDHSKPACDQELHLPKLLLDNQPDQSTRPLQCHTTFISTLHAQIASSPSIQVHRNSYCNRNHNRVPHTGLVSTARAPAHICRFGWSEFHPNPSSHSPPHSNSLCANLTHSPCSTLVVQYPIHPRSSRLQPQSSPVWLKLTPTQPHLETLSASPLPLPPAFPPLRLPLLLFFFALPLLACFSSALVLLAGWCGSAAMFFFPALLGSQAQWPSRPPHLGRRAALQLD